MQKRQLPGKSRARTPKTRNSLITQFRMQTRLRRTVLAKKDLKKRKEI